MKSINLAEIEKHPDTDTMVEALTSPIDTVEWTHLFSANGKHAIGVRKDPSEDE